MPWIKWVPEEEAEGDLANQYEKFKSPEGGVDHILKIHSVNHPSLDYHYQYYSYIMRGKSGLTRAEREMIAVAVSRSNDCFY